MKFEQIKQGEFLPLLFAGIGAASALAGGVSAIANTIKDRKHKIAVEREQERHKKEIEKIVNNVKTLQVESGIKKKKKKINPLTNFDIIKVDKKIKHFRGCFMRDELPKETLTNACGMLNLNNSEQKGSHWVAWIKEGNLKIYFDPYGNDNSPRELVKYFGENNLRITSRKFQDYNDPPICGHLCLDFIKNYNKYI